MKKLLSLFSLIGVISVGQSAICQPWPENPFDIQSQYANSYWKAYRVEESLKSDFRQATAISVYLVPPGKLRPVKTDEGSIELIGCKYETDNSRLIADLAEIMANADIRTSSRRVEYFEPVEAIHLTLASGRKSSLQLGGILDDAGQPRVPGLWQRSEIIADNKLRGNLYRWLAKLQPVMECEPIIRPYRVGNSRK